MGSRAARGRKGKPLRDSHSLRNAQARRVGRPGNRKLLDVTLVLKRAVLDDDHPVARKVRQIESRLPADRPTLSEEELRQFHGAEEAHLERVRSFAKARGLEVVFVSEIGDEVVLRGTVQGLNQAFGVTLEHFEDERGRYRAHREPIHLPEELHDAVEGVLGLDDIPMIRRMVAGAATDNLISIPEIARHYRFPSNVRGNGQRIAILSFAAGFFQADLDRFYARLKRKTHRPGIHAIGGSRGNQPLDYPKLRAYTQAYLNGDSLGQLRKKFGSEVVEEAFYTIENTMDLEIASAAAPGAEIDIYFAAPTALGISQAIRAASGIKIPGAVRSASRPQAATVISISWGWAEKREGEVRLRTIDPSLELAKNRHISICCASGDYGSLGEYQTEDVQATVLYPGSSPWALACGGTKLAPNGDEAEPVWNQTLEGAQLASGGGVSGFFPLPDYQVAAGVPPNSALKKPAWLAPSRKEPGFRGRGVPDVAANALFNYATYYGGATAPAGGTSAATPLWAGLLALMGQSLGRPVGFLNGQIYRKSARKGFTDVIRGNNRLRGAQVASFCAHPGWDACSGWGTPVGDRLRDVLARANG